MRRLLLATAIAVTVSTVALAATTPAPLIERTKLFGNPSRAAGRISPDGKWLSWLAPRDGVMNIWIAPVADPTKAKVLTTEKIRPIRAYFWAPDASMILFINDKGGDENFLLYGVDVATGAQKSLTPFEKTRAEIVGMSRQVKDRILVGLNNRDPRWHDVYSLNLKSGELTQVFKNEGFASFLADRAASPARRRQAPRGRRLGPLRDRGRQGFRQADRNHRARRRQDDGADWLQHRRKDSLLAGFPRAQHRLPGRPGHHDGRGTVLGQDPHATWKTRWPIPKPAASRPIPSTT
jgi:hypothetical protein